ncbi:MAG: C-terminal helicase domain-containing protein [Xanthomonadales bacterium]|nr:C-terminal helicase domain-containing protein [Xanthomonadales bacterium]
MLSADSIFRELVVQRSRSYAMESQKREIGESAMFPKRASPRVAEYSIRNTYGHLLKEFDKAFQKDDPLFTLAMYYPLNWFTGDRSEIEVFEENRQKQVVGLIRTGFLKRFESSVPAFQLSCDRLLRKLMAFVEVNSESEGETSRFERWKAQHHEILGYASQRFLDLKIGQEENDADEDLIPPELLKNAAPLDRNEYDVSEMLNETFLDMGQLATFLTETSRFEVQHDDKLKKLIRLLKGKDLSNEKVLIFTEFADTARYLMRELKKAGIEGVDEIDSGTKLKRSEVIRRFAPYYNGSSSCELADEGIDETRILISTDVLSEGLNLQDATKMINYDIHWNPVRLMQRIGRVDRRMSPEIEERIRTDHPERSESRGRILYWNFLPPDELNEILTLFSRVSQKTLVISKTFGIEGRKLLTPDDDYDPLREFNHAYEGTRTAVEDMHLEFQQLVKDDPELEHRLNLLPGALFSGRKRLKKGARGMFFCYTLPALDTQSNEFKEEAGRTGWYLVDFDRDEILEEPGEIVESIRSKPGTPRLCVQEETTLIDLRTRVEKHITNTYLKRVDAPVGVKPRLVCWMEMNDE